MDGRTGAQHHGWLLAQWQKWRRPRQRISGARVDQYRCCLPALAEFSIYRRGGTDGATIETGGEEGIRTLEAGFSRLHTFQACSFDRSDTSPNRAVARGGLRRITGMGNAHKAKRGGVARMQPLCGGIRGQAFGFPGLTRDIPVAHPAGRLRRSRLQSCKRSRFAASGLRLRTLGLAALTWHNGWSPPDRAHDLSGSRPQMAPEAVR